MNTDREKIVRIGGASGFWGDSTVAAPQLAGHVDYLVFDYLAETTMAILAGARARNPALGYATDFVEDAMKSVLVEIAAGKVRVVSNAGGMNPRGCAEALSKLAAAQGLTLRIAVVDGDDVSGKVDEMRKEGVRCLESGEELPARMLSANAYLGAPAIAQALASGADVVITGRCVDSAVTLGVLMHEFGWAPRDFDRLASGSLAGHIIECGCQATGGLHTDWQDVPDWAHMGYPIIECRRDGSFVVTKPPGTGGKVTRANVVEQMLYEIGDPSAYVLPDVTCDFRQVVVTQEGTDRVLVSPARGSAPPATYKVSATWQDGYRCTGMMVIVGIDAVLKARRTGQAVIERTQSILRQRGQPPLASTYVDVVGGESMYGPHSRARAAREVLMRVAATHPDQSALVTFSREIAPSGTSWSPGTTSTGAGRPPVRPLIRPFSFLMKKAVVSVHVEMAGERSPVSIPEGSAIPAEDRAVASSPPAYAWPDEKRVPLRLIDIAWGRSGDKGDLSNIGLVARRSEWLPLLWECVTPEVVRSYFAHLVKGKVDRFYLPGTDSLNLVMHEALDGGGPSSMRLDPLGKGMAQILLDLEIMVPSSIASIVKGKTQ